MKVGTGSKAIELVTVQPQGKKPMAAADWARGIRLTDEDRLGAERVSDRNAPQQGAAAAPGPVRRVAYQVIRQVTAEGGYANLALNKALRDAATRRP